MIGPSPTVTNERPAPHSPPPDRCYVPGYRTHKLVMLLAALFLAGIGLRALWTPLRLLWQGVATTAEATRVIKSRPGMPDQFFTDDQRLREMEQSRDRSFLYINEFAFRTAAGERVVTRLPVYGQLRPLYRLLDEDGLPTTVWIRYHPQRPSEVVFPWVFGTWFVPGTLVFLGLAAAGIAATLLIWANKPIPLPASMSDTPEDKTPQAQYNAKRSLERGESA